MELCIKTRTYINVYFITSKSFNPCFNGTMYKNDNTDFPNTAEILSFNPCFNGSMYKNYAQWAQRISGSLVSILVLMDLCIKTIKELKKNSS